ncbi:hypothetical protein MKY41_05210 [Sporosarcina sp. FSL W7-1349]|uniref:hypothetical protein n=1 Tax=Sporosarcina sp. FSL W7-1349 TaxID=2921561 RepID=UPI0030F669B4
MYAIKVSGEIAETVKPLSKKNGFYYAFEYDRAKKSLLQVGIRSDEASAVYVKQDNVTMSLTQSKNGIWYHASSKWKEGPFSEKTDSIFGLNAGGDFTVQCVKNGELFEEAQAIIIPQVFSLEEYRYMQKEVQQLLEVFSLDVAKEMLNEPLYLKRVQRHLYPLRQLEQFVMQFSTVLEEILDIPAFTLTSEPVKKHTSQIKKWTPRTLIEQATTGKEYFNVNQTIRTNQLIEHPMIRTMLLELLERIQTEAEQEQIVIKRLKADATKLEVASQRRGTISLNDFKQRITDELKILEGRASAYLTLQGKLTPYLEAELFHTEPVPVEETYLFRMDIKYKEVFEIYTSFTSLRANFESAMQPFVKSLLKSPSLYENWLLLKMVEQLAGWGFDTRQFVEWIRKNYSTKGTLDGLDEVFELPQMPFRMRILFNVYLTDFDMQPDFIIGIQNKNTQIWQWHTADAKYKQYNEKTVSVLETDLERSAKRYKQTICLERQAIQSSVLIHPVQGIHFWNLRDSSHKKHSLSHFNVTPFDTSALNIYFKRLLHEFGGFAEICPTCSTPASGEIDPVRRGKTTYKCENCEEVWVKSYCGSCARANRQQLFYTPEPLYKYAIDNYNTQVGDEWNVHCPTCFADANRNTFKQGVSLLMEELHPVAAIFYNPSRSTPPSRPCRKCGGRGFIGHFRHIQGGECFDCHGSGRV